MVMGIELARSITWEAAWRISKGLPASMEASMAKALAGDAYVRAATLGHQVHGGVGLIREHPMHLYYREARTASYAFGDAAHHLGRIADAVAAGAQVW